MGANEKISLAGESASSDRKRRLPPFASVRAFEAAARHMSFAKAADELLLTPSAISHQIRGLEDYLATKLFERQGNQMRLTMTGRTYAERLTVLMDDFAASTEALRNEQDDAPIRVLSTPGFAARWLVPRLSRFEHAGRVRIRTSVGAPSTDFQSNEADVVIAWSVPNVANAETRPLMRSARFPVASPAVIEREGLNSPADLRRATLMQDETDDQWADWFGAAGVAPPEMTGPMFPNCELATTAVEQGLGVSLAYDMMVRDTLKSGRVIRLFDTVTLPMTIYSIVTPGNRTTDPAISRFQEFLIDEVDADGRP